MSGIGPRKQIADVLRYPIYGRSPRSPFPIELRGWVTQWTREIYGRRYRFYHCATAHSVHLTAQPYDPRPGGNTHDLHLRKDTP